MNKALFKNTFGWGFVLWFIGYMLGIVLFFMVPPAYVGWVILPIGTAITIWALCKKIRATSLQQYTAIAISWTLIAAICDYLFLVKIFNPTDGYYKTDVYLYYILTLILPLIIGIYKNRTRSIQHTDKKD